MTTTTQLANQQKITFGIMGLLSVLILGFGGYMVLNQEQLDHAYVCTISEKVGFFDSLSSSGKTGYWVSDDGLNKSSVCTNGEWKPLKAYAKEKGVDIGVFLKTSNMADSETSGNPIVVNNYIPNSGNGSLKVRCDVNGCYPIG